MPFFNMQLPAGIELVETADGSPSLAHRRADGYVEHMHHSRGALGESAYVYGGALGLARASLGSLRLISVGLGLGYNELITLAAADERPTTIWSFETSTFLREQFAAWARGDDRGALAPIYDRVAVGIDSAAGAGSSARVRAGRALERGDLRLVGSFPTDLAHVTKANLVYFDAYSNKMNADLWDEDALVAAFEGCLAQECVFASYAVTGTLKRALARLAFTRIKRRGFSYRKESTLATRGLPGTLAPPPGSLD